LPKPSQKPPIPRPARPEKLSRAATIIDVANLAGVAVGTVSRFLNGVEIRPSEREAVEEAIRVLRYNRNAVAKGRCAPTRPTSWRC
jgi:Bacterial regulatory proteins, lacI family